MQVKRLVLAALCGCGLIAPLASVNADVSSSAVLFLRIAPGARAAGMGEAFVAVSDDATATHWNPAGLGAAPLADNWIEAEVPSKFRPLKGIAAVSRGAGRDYDDYDVWAISPLGLVRYDHKSWSNGEVFATRTDETIATKVANYFNVTEEEKLNGVIDKVARSNNSGTWERLDKLTTDISATIPSEYSGRDELQANIDSLRSAFRQVRVNWERVKNLESVYADAMEDQTVSTSEADKLNFAAEKTVLRFIPEEITIPYDALTVGELTSIAASDDVLYVGSTEGLIYYNGRAWQHVTTTNGLPSNNILTLVRVGSHVAVGTDKGLVLMTGLAIDSVKTHLLPSGPVTAIGGNSTQNIFAVVNNDLYRYDGQNWSNTRAYKVVIDDTPEKIATRFAIYGTPSEKSQYLEKLEKSAIGPTGVVPTGNEGATSATPLTLEASLTPGNTVQIPYLAHIKGEVYSIFVGAANDVWLGTEYGLLRLTDSGWQLPGYRRETIIEGQTLADIVKMRRLTDVGQQAEYEQTLRAINELERGDVAGGTTILRQVNAAALPVHDITRFDDKVYFTTPIGLRTYENGEVRRGDFADMDKNTMSGVASQGGETYFASSNKVVTKARGRTAVSLNHTPWLPELAPDLHYDFLGVTFNKENIGTFGLNFTYISYGTIVRVDENQVERGTFDSYDAAVTLSYGTSLTSKLKFGLSGKIIHSRLADQGAGQEQGKGTATAIAADVGMLYHITPRLNFGLAVTNIGPNVAYIDANQADPLPRNLAIGFAYKAISKESVDLLLVGEANKMLVGLNDRFTREVGSEVIYNAGAELSFIELIALRGGYIYDEEGQVKTVTLGLGLRPIKSIQFDISYIPSNDNVALANTIRYSISGMF